MPKGENLIPIQSTEKARELGRKGGIKSGEVRRKKRALKETMAMLLELPVMDEKIAKRIEKFGVEPGDLDNYTRLMYTLLQEAFKGNLSAIHEVQNIVDASNTEDSSAIKVVFSNEIEEYLEKP